MKKITQIIVSLDLLRLEFTQSDSLRNLFKIGSVEDSFVFLCAPSLLYLLIYAFLLKSFACLALGNKLVNSVLEVSSVFFAI